MKSGSVQSRTVGKTFLVKQYCVSVQSMTVGIYPRYYVLYVVQTYATNIGESSNLNPTWDFCSDKPGMFQPKRFDTTSPDSSTTAIGSVPSSSGYAIAYRWRSLLRVRRHRASEPQGSSERVVPWQVTHYGPINIRLSFPHPLLV